MKTFFIWMAYGPLTRSFWVCEQLISYVFLVDIEGHRSDSLVAEALEAVRTQVSMMKVLGSYPMSSWRDS